MSSPDSWYNHQTLKWQFYGVINKTEKQTVIDETWRSTKNLI